MAWIYLAESEDSQSLSTNGLDQSPTARSTPIVKESSCPELRLVNLRIPPYGMILKHWTGLDSHGDMSISYLEASHAKILALLEKEKAWRESEADYFSRSCAWPKKSSPNSYSLKIRKESSLMGDYKSLNRSPKSGMIVDSIFYPLMNSLTKTVKDGFVLPNLMASDGSKGPAKEYNRKGKQSSMRNLVTISYRIWRAGVLTPEVCEKIMGYPFGWSELSHWAIPFVRSKQKKRSKS